MGKTASEMRIKEIEATTVSVPLNAPLMWAMGVHRASTRTVVRLLTDEGVVGYGETPGAAAKQLIEGSVGKAAKGLDAFEIERFLAKSGISQRFHNFVSYQNTLRAAAGVEMACWDAIGKSVGRPVCELIGGRFRERVGITGYIYPRHRGKGNVGGENTPEKIAGYCKKIVKNQGFTMLELKFGVFKPQFDLETIKLVREELGEEIEIRVDPNSSWSPETSIRTMNKLAEFDVSVVEEPCFGLTALARVKASTKIPISSHAQFMIPEVSALKSADAIAGDPHECGGILMIKKIAAAAEAHNLAMWLHSGGELGVSTAAYAHISASSPHMIHPNQGTYEHNSDDIIKGGALPISEGTIAVPRKPGLGVEVDEKKLAKYASLYEQMGEAYYSAEDADRPDWVLSLPKW